MTQAAPVEQGSFGLQHVAMIAVFGAIVGAAIEYNASQQRGSSRSSTAVAEADIESAAIAAQLATLAVQGQSMETREIEFAPIAPTKRSGAVQMFSEGDIGVLPPLGVYDPLGLIETRDMRRYTRFSASQHEGQL